MTNLKFIAYQSYSDNNNSRKQTFWTISRLMPMSACRGIDLHVDMNISLESAHTKLYRKNSE